ncbi:protein unc-45 homolog A [Callorhinchus milii]|uniref:Unc-45 myosin chaperone A n=1 Tax=Callorhinchus milii TaxID=7868 RepID=A0A4W3I282_CALMI|nr:protein unc-45 homolog A [Callorhinchus milii]|eukprot:gi/632938878/ref/XP_007906761.1/ PREDICTED: protein unc-45 homolog A [Callorhinchus milii]
MSVCNGETVSLAQLREEGNKYFKLGDHEAALSCYTQAIKLSPEQPSAAVLHRNRAACYLKLEEYSKAEADASKAIEADGKDVKALFRRSQALQKLGRLDQAFADNQRCAVLEPKNKVFQESLRLIATQIQQKVHLQSSTDARVEQMFNILLDAGEKDSDKKQKAVQNLIVLAREDAGAQRIFRSDGVRLLQKMLDTGSTDIMLASLRTLVGLCSGHQSRAMAILNTMGMDKFCRVMSVSNEQVSLAACSVLQGMFEALKGGIKSEVRGKEEALVLDPSKELRTMIYHLIEMLTKQEVSVYGRENSINLLIKNVPRKSLRDPDNSMTIWVIDQGMKKILQVAETVSEIPGSLVVTESSRMSLSVLMSKLYDDLKSDAERENFHKLCEDYVRNQFESQGMNGKLRAIQTASTLLQGPSEVGNRVLEMSGILECMISLCASEREIDQLVAVEALIHAAGKSKRASFITANGVMLLKEIYKKNDNDQIKIRALVGLCKVGSAGGTDCSIKQFAEGSTCKLAKQCRRWLCNEVIQSGTRRWAMEGLAYLTFDADVKEEFVEDQPAMHAMFELAKSEDKTALFAIASTLVNCTNSYDKEEPDPQLLELAKYAKQHIPEEHPKDKTKYVEKRIAKLLKMGVVSALVCMVKKESPTLTESCKEMISRVFLALVESPDGRGIVVAQGGGKALVSLSSEGTDVGKIKAGQALAKITITSNAEIAFPGERIYEVIRPLIALLHLQCTALQNFESLMALTNLAGINERLRQKIIKEKAIPMIDSYMFEDHDMIRLAATECMCNMSLSPEVQAMFLAEGNDRLKLLVLYSGEDDDKLRSAASGAVALLTSLQPELCQKITQVTTHWLEILQALLLSPNLDLQRRGVVIVLNMMNADRDLAAQLIESEMLEILSHLAKEGDEKIFKIKDNAKECLAKAVEYGLIKPNECEDVPTIN